jgi:hypothetical protein
VVDLTKFARVDAGRARRNDGCRRHAHLAHGHSVRVLGAAAALSWVPVLLRQIRVLLPGSLRRVDPKTDNNGSDEH